MFPEHFFSRTPQDGCFWMLKSLFKNICISNINKLIFGHLNIKSIRNKFDVLSEKVKGPTDIVLVSETELDDIFPEGQFLIEDFHSPF